MEFSYAAVDYSGKKQKGLLEAASEREVLEYLRSRKLFPLKIRVRTQSAIPFIHRISSGDIVLFTRQLSSMMLSGLTLIESLQILKKQTLKPQMQKVIDSLLSDISEGKSFSTALESHREIFSEVYISLIKAAEAGGLLDKVLARLADNLERMDDLKKSIRSAMFYPIIILVGVAGVITVMNMFVIPQLGKLYESLNISLPLSTKIVLGISRIFTNFYPLMILLGIVFAYLFRRIKKTELGRRTLDKIKLKFPIIGGIITISILDEISRTLSLLIGSGTSIIEALNITANVANNVWYKNAILSSRFLVEKGIPLSQALEQQLIFPPVLIQLTKVGEATGRIDDSLVRVAEYFERDMTLRVKTLTTSIEPILIFVLGIVVAFLIMSVITPIYGLISQIQ